ncbi:cytidine deaminase, partial [Vibrio sp. M260118]
MRSRIEKALSEVPQKVADFLSPIVFADDFDATLSNEQFEQLLA